jgi:hypothetical protein
MFHYIALQMKDGECNCRGNGNDGEVHLLLPHSHHEVDVDWIFDCWNGMDRIGLMVWTSLSRKMCVRKARGNLITRVGIIGQKHCLENP